MTPHIGICLRTILVAALLAILAATLPARGNDRQALHALVTVEGPLVTLGDLVSGAGAAADVAVFRAPDPGTTGTVSVARVLRAAREHGLSPAGEHLETITVTRASRRIAAEEVVQVISERLAGPARQATDDVEIDIQLEGFEQSMHIEASSAAPLELRSFEHDRGTGRFAAVMAIADSRIAAAGFPVSGRATESIEVPVALRAVRRGETIGPGDIALERLARRQLQAGTIRNLEEIIGQAAKRGLRAGAPISADSLMEPILVSRNDQVTIIYRVAGMTLTARGRAIGAGSRGDLITVINSQSNRTIEAEVARAGVVTVAARGNSAMADAGR